MIERIDNNGNYEPGNCRWASRYDQSRNTRQNRLITAFGETKCLTDWVNDPICSVKISTVHGRLRKGWVPEEAISTPPLNRWGQPI